MALANVKSRGTLFDDRIWTARPTIVQAGKVNYGFTANRPLRQVKTVANVKSELVKVALAKEGQSCYKTVARSELV